MLHSRVQHTNSLYEITNHAEPRCYTGEYNIQTVYEITNHAEPRCYTVEYNIQTVYMKLQIMLSQGATL